jgi:hypothetical protein
VRVGEVNKANHTDKASGSNVHRFISKRQEKVAQA